MINLSTFSARVFLGEPNYQSRKLLIIQGLQLFSADPQQPYPLHQVSVTPGVNDQHDLRMRRD